MDGAGIALPRAPRDALEDGGDGRIVCLIGGVSGEFCRLVKAARSAQNIGTDGRLCVLLVGKQLARFTRPDPQNVGLQTEPARGSVSTLVVARPRPAQAAPTRGDKVPNGFAGHRGPLEVPRKLGAIVELTKRGVGRAGRQLTQREPAWFNGDIPVRRPGQAARVAPVDLQGEVLSRKRRRAGVEIARAEAGRARYDRDLDRHPARRTLDRLHVDRCHKQPVEGERRSLTHHITSSSHTATAAQGSQVTRSALDWKYVDIRNCTRLTRHGAAQRVAALLTRAVRAPGWRAVKNAAHGGVRGRHTRRVLLAAGLSALCASPAPASPLARASDRDCADFTNQAQAQEYFLAQGGPSADPDRLDGDPGDGVACESLPCPCNRSTRRDMGARPTPTRRTRVIAARIVSVIDGDTVKVRYGKTPRTVRIIGIDTPETRRPGVAVECGGPEATASMKRLAPVGARIVVRTDPSQDTFDRYDRLLAYLRRGRRDLGRTQISRGWAKTYVYGGKPFQRTTGYRRSQKRAKRLRRGVYGKCGGDFHTGQARASAPRRTRITAMRMKLRGVGTPGAGYDVEVAIRVRVCGRVGAVAFHITEAASPPDRNGPILARRRHAVTQDQIARCDTHRITWILQNKFFGVSRYRVSLRARTTGRAWSRVASQHVDTYD